MRKVRSWLSIESSDPPLPPLGQLPEPSFEFQVKSCCPGIDEAEKRGRKAYCQAKVNPWSVWTCLALAAEKTQHAWNILVESILNNFYNILSKLKLVDAERGDCSELNIWQNDSRLKMLKLQLWKWAAHIFDCSCGPILKYNFLMPTYPDLSLMGIISF